MRFDVQEFVDRQRIGPVHLAVLATCTLVMFVDGYDIFMVGRIAPAIADGFGVKPAALTPVFSYQQVGLAIGAFLTTALADRLGRRRLLVACYVVFGLLTFACLAVRDLGQLAWLRGISGIFLSGGLPVAMALLAEITPARRRSTFLAVGLAGYSFGAAFGSAVAAWMVVPWGWQSGFWLGGILPLAAAALLIAVVPESIQYRVARNAADPTVPRTLRRLDPALVLTGAEEFAVGDGSRRLAKASPLDIFREGRARITVLLWLACIFSLSTTALISSWLTTYFRDLGGISLQAFAIASFVTFAGGLCGTISIGWLLDRVRATRLIAIYYVGMGIAYAALGTVPFGTAAFVAVYFIAGFCQTGGQAGINSLTTQLYPMSMRSTGLGWSGGAGRVVSIAAPSIGVLALTSGLSLQQTMLLVGLPPLCVALFIFLIGPHGGDHRALHRAPA